MQVFDTLQRAMVPLTPRREGEISMYVCGPTVQSEPHLGHGRSAVAFDVIRRYLRWRGYRVQFVMNITDIEDKIIAAAAEREVPVAELAEQMAKRFQDAYRELRVAPPDIEPRATEHIPEMIELITTLVERGLAYEAEGDVYFSVRALPGYGKLSGRNLDDLRSGARVEPGEQKRDPLDFALWKAAKAGEPAWVSPWGEGRPGWHIECSAMAVQYLGAGFDIHGGGSDLIFPHHENEIAQSEGAGTAFSRIWLHNGMLNLGGEKMAKSTGHVIDLATAIDRYGGGAVRLFFLRAHYRSPLEYSEELLEDAAASLERLHRFEERSASLAAAEPDQEILDRFIEAMDEDFGTAEAVGLLFEVVREGNRRLDVGAEAAPLAAAFRVMAEVLGLGRPADRALTDLASRLADLAAELGTTAGATPEAIVADLIDRRAAARAGGDFATADSIRLRLADLGIVLEDGRDGTRWLRR